MPIVRNFIRHSSPQGLEEYFTTKNIAVLGVDWSLDQATVAGNVIQLIDHLPPEDQARLRVMLSGLITWRTKLARPPY